MMHLFEGTAIVNSEDREGKTKRRFFCQAPGKSVWLHLLAFLSPFHPASRFLTLLHKLLLSVSLEFCSWCALTHNSLFKSPIISLALYRPPFPRDRYSCVSAMAKSMRRCPATTNTPPCQLMTLGGIPRFTSPWLPSWVPGWISGKKVALWQSSQCRVTVEVTSATRLWQPRPPTHFHYYRFLQCVLWERNITDWEVLEINWLYYLCGRLEG